MEFRPHTVYASLDVADLTLGGGEAVYLVDYAGPPGFARRLATLLPRGRVVVLDHHKTSAAELQDPQLQSLPSLEVHFDMERSGATVRCVRVRAGRVVAVSAPRANDPPHPTLPPPPPGHDQSHDYFEPQGLSEEQRQLYAYIEDGDLWRWSLPQSRAFHAGLAALGLEYDATRNPHIFDQLLALTPGQVIAAGEPVLAEEARAVEGALGAAFPVRLGGAGGRWGRCLAVRVEGRLAQLRSQLGNALAERSRDAGLRAMGLVAYVEPAMGDDSQIKCSLRGLGGEDTTAVSESHGGGGHKAASSFILPLAEFEGWREGGA